MFLIGVVVTGFAILFSLTALALRASGRLRHVGYAAIALVATLGAGLALLLES